MKVYETYRGVGLLEYLLGLALLSLLLTWGAPSFVGFHQYYQMRSSVQSIIGGLQYARAAAMQARQPMYVHIASLYPTDLDWRIAIHPDNNARSYQQILSGASQVAQGNKFGLSSTDSTIGFSALHGRTYSAGHIKLQNPQNLVEVKIIYHNSSGRIRACSVGEARYGYEAC
jgi:type IV fimbrial biogenesis protein FimT